MKEIAWILGHSGAGKETFSKNFCDKPDPELVKQLGWQGLRIDLIESSIKLVSRGKGDTTHQKRDDILNELEKKKDKLDIAVVKYQAVDFETQRVERIRKMFPDEILIRALVIDTEQEVIKKRLLQRRQHNNWDPWEDWNEFFSFEQKHILKALKTFDQVDYIDTSKGYELSSNPISR